MISKEKVKSLIANKLDEGDYFIVSLEISTTNKIKLLIDSMSGINIVECVAFSREIEHNLDREAEDFELEVASPGLHLPLQVKQQYIKNVGRQLDVLLEDGNTRIKGLLKEVLEDSIIVEEEKKERVEGKKKKQLISTEHHISFDNINKANIVLKF
jgi:ribosome maturation factor RimP